MLNYIYCFRVKIPSEQRTPIIHFLPFFTIMLTHPMPHKPHSRARSTKTRIETKKPWQFSLQPRNRHQLPVTKVYIIALAASLLALCFFPAWPVLVEEPKVQVQVKIGLLVAPSISKE